ncbi:DNA polymerase IV [Metamycoplasma arthritidis]|uniref:Pol_IV_kappa DNA polymerase n=1 Tax=Metamycoplasma arthritidis (strain 158L3-1) TaxID=243272 RepID=B3PM57_META1|nr:DNA polymerase IV [Metamycoplasma arthritidis]ACF07109.1 Pol_IV_kappa DNA polymerase [Metamycoplasma arthritidis 158L3-1]VEU78637.1 DNA polymerase IV [Metamycoplasma arthritidis]
MLEQNRTIFHIDMDAFFINCERAIDPRLDNQPVAIGKVHKRSIATSVSYELKKLGLRPGDPSLKVKHLCPNVIFVEPHYQLYSSYSKRIFDYLETHYTHTIEIYSIDECYLEVTTILNNRKISAQALAFEIQKNILDKFQLPCSIGISFTKFLAKMSTNKAKPFGILETKKQDIEKHFYDLDIQEIFGVGKASTAKLKEYGINTYRDLVNEKNTQFLRSVFGKRFYSLILELKGDNLHDHVQNEEAKGISNSMSFIENNIADFNEISNCLYELAENVSERAKITNVEGSTITVMIRWANKNWSSKQKRIHFYTNEVNDIYNFGKDLLESLWDQSAIRGIGIAISNLRSIFNRDNAFDLFCDFKGNKINNIINSINQEFQKGILKTGTQLQKEKQNTIRKYKMVKEENLRKANKDKE